MVSTVRVTAGPCCVAEVTEDDGGDDAGEATEPVSAGSAWFNVDRCFSKACRRGAEVVAFVAGVWGAKFIAKVVWCGLIGLLVVLLVMLFDELVVFGLLSLLPV